MKIRWIAESRENGELAARVGRDGDHLVAEFPGQGTLRVRRDGTGPVFEADPAAAPRDVDKLRRGPVRLLLHHLAGEIALHGAAVAIDGRALVFLGASSVGKSTLAASVCARGAATLLGDDAVAIAKAITGYDVLPLETSCWLDAPSARAIERSFDDESDKAPFAVPASDAARVPLAAIVHLAFVESDAPRLVPVSGLDAAAGLLAQLTRFVLDDPEVARRDLLAAGDLVASTPVYRLERPRRLDRLREAQELLADLVRKGPS